MPWILISRYDDVRKNIYHIHSREECIAKVYGKENAELILKAVSQYKEECEKC